MKQRFLLAAALALVGLIASLSTCAAFGSPWGWRAHRAVVLDAAGTVELVPSDERRAREGLSDGALAPAPGMFLDAGDALRVARFSEARVRLKSTGDHADDATQLTIGDGARVQFPDGQNARDAGAPLTLLERGVVTLTAPAGSATQRIAIAIADATVDITPKAEGAEARVVTDGKGLARVFVRRGTVTVRNAASALEVGAESLVAIEPGQPPRAEQKAAALALSVSCVANQLVVDAAPLTEIFAQNQLRYAGTEPLRIDIAAGATAPRVFARDALGRVALAHDVVCPAAPAPPAVPAVAAAVPKTALPKPAPAKAPVAP